MNAPAPGSGRPDRFEAARLEKLNKIVELGHDPFGQRFDGHRPIAEIRPLCPEAAGTDGAAVRIAGRIMLRRKAGKLRFFDVQDASGKVQLLFSRGDLTDAQWELMSQFDLGDLIGVDGAMRRTESGEVSIFVRDFTILGKSLAQPPEKWHGLEDVETRLRQRYSDLIYSEGVRDKLLLRSRIVDSVRQTLRSRGFVEVETPVLHAIAGGAAARPFITHHNALDIQLFLRIALELHLKRLLVGGIEKVYELGRVFRNEGIDATHNPEFTMLEAYQAYGDYESMMDLTEAVVVNAARAVQDSGFGIQDSGKANERLVLPWGEGTIDLTPPWPRTTYGELFEKHVGIAMTDHAAVRAKWREHFRARVAAPVAANPSLAATGEDHVAGQHPSHGPRKDQPAGKPPAPTQLDPEAAHPDVLISELFEEFVEPHIGRGAPVFCTDYPAAICPLTKRKRGAPHLAERFELFINGMELANAYTELNDARLQEELFRTQLAGLPEEESMAKMDHDFIRALKVGMPPAGGLGIGIDRLVMLLTNSQTIRDIIFFPLLRPET
ncbi:MAG: lysine--tRNA ligase [Planctomycetaceae bacterium]|nr:lysine--tRNA ligase [Planctomycetaceae bacterium]